MAEIVCPGKRLGRVGEFRAGPGTYVRGSHIFASVVGPKVEQAGADEDGKPFLIVSTVSWTLVLFSCCLGCILVNERLRCGNALAGMHWYCARRCWCDIGDAGLE